MIKVPYEVVREKIKDSAKISDAELDDKIKAKIDKLSGLISKEGAAHIIANELGIKLFEQASGRLKIKNILAGMRNVEIVGRVQQVFEVREFQTETRSGKVGSFVIGDETGTIRVVLWGSQADKLAELSSNKVIKIQSAYVKDNKGRKELHLGDQGVLDLNPEGEAVGEVRKAEFSRKNIKDLAENMTDAEILGTIVQVYDMKFFEVCPQCGKKTLPKEAGTSICTNHGTVGSAYSYVFNTVLDDGTGNIRVAFFKRQIENLLGKPEQDIIMFKDSPDKFEKVKYDLLGKQIKVAGRVNKNMMFDRIEFVAQLVFANPDPKEEIVRLEKENAKNNPQASSDPVAQNADSANSADKKPLFSVDAEKEGVVSFKDI
jgi:replication factor A1